jgi:hypothetical protein
VRVYIRAIEVRVLILPISVLWNSGVVC